MKLLCKLGVHKYKSNVIVDFSEIIHYRDGSSDTKTCYIIKKQCSVCSKYTLVTEGAENIYSEELLKYKLKQSGIDYET